LIYPQSYSDIDLRAIIEIFISGSDIYHRIIDCCMLRIIEIFTSGLLIDLPSGILSYLPKELLIAVPSGLLRYLPPVGLLIAVPFRLLRYLL